MKLRDMVKVAIEGHQSMTPFMYGYCQLDGVWKFQAVQYAEAGREHGDLRIDHSQAPSSIRAEEATIALGQSLLPGLKGTAHHFCQGHRSHDREYAASVDGSKDRLEGFSEIATFQHIDDGAGIDEN